LNEITKEFCESVGMRKSVFNRWSLGNVTWNHSLNKVFVSNRWECSIALDEVRTESQLVSLMLAVNKLEDLPRCPT